MKPRQKALLQYAAKRAALILPIVLVIASLNFFLVKLAPGDAAEVLAGESGSASAEYVERLREQFGINRPLPQQYVAYMSKTLRGDLGYSFRQQEPVAALIIDRLGPTLLLMTTALLASVLFGVFLGVIAGFNVHRWPDLLISTGALLGYATPLFWLGLMLVLLFSIKLDLLPTSGLETIGAFYEGWDRVQDIAAHLVLPALTLSAYYIAVYARLMRASILEQMQQDYVSTARAKGLTENRVRFVHVLKNAMLPVLTMSGIQMGNLFGGAVVIESVFGWPGIGLLAYDALLSRDINLLLGIFFVSAVLVIVANLIVDLIYAVVDPRVKLA